MKAVAVLPSRREVAILDQPEPGIRSATDVKVRVLEVGVCGTDREICGFHYGTPPDGSEHLVIGHEMLGEVAEVGDGVTMVKKGDLVVPTVRRPCRHETCPSCSIGRQDFCYTGDFVERGIKQRHGYMTEYVVDDEQYFVRVPRELRDVAVLVEPLTIAEKALIQVWQVQQRLPWGCPHAGNGGPGACHHAVVLGAGPIGLLGAMAFRAAGFTTFVYSRESETSEKAELVRSFEAHYISAETTQLEKLTERIGTIDVVYEATGASKFSFEVMKHVGANAAFIFTGVPGLKGAVEVDADFIMRGMVLKNQVIFGTVNAGKDAFEAAVRDLTIFMRRWPAATRKLITARYPLSRALEPLRSTDGIKSVIEMK